MKHFFTIAAMVCCFVAAFGQNEVMTNKKVIDLAKAKFDDAVIIGMFKNAKANFNTSTDSVIYLAQNGVSQTVIKAMVDRNTINYPAENMKTTEQSKFSETPIEKEASKEDMIKAAMKNCYVATDQMHGTNSYLSSRTPKDRTDVDRIFAFIFQENGKEPLLGFGIYHNALQNQMNDYMNIQMIYIRIDADVRKFLMTPNNYHGGATMHSYYQNIARAEPSGMFSLLKAFSISKNTKIRFEGYGKTLEFDASNKEKKAIIDVLDLYAAMTSK